MTERLQAIPSFLHALILKNLNVQFKSNFLMIISSSASTSSLSDAVAMIFQFHIPNVREGRGNTVIFSTPLFDLCASALEPSRATTSPGPPLL